MWRIFRIIIKQISWYINESINSFSKKCFSSITAGASSIDAGIQKEIYGSGTTTLIISNEEMNDVMEIVQAIEDYNILLKGVTKIIKIKQKNKKDDF